MTQKELKDYFSDRMYDDIREYVYLIMLEHPEVTEPYTIEAAACEIQESKTDGVNLSVDNALRLVAGEKPADMKEVCRILSSAGINSDADIIDVLNEAAGREMESSPHEDMSAEAFGKVTILMNAATMLARNKDIVILGLPEADRMSDYMILRVAFFTDTLTDRERKLLEAMKLHADKTNMEQRECALLVFFKVFHVWDN